MKKSQSTKAINAFISKHNHTLSTRELIEITNCISPSNLITYLITRKNCIFSKEKKGHLIFYTLLNVDSFSSEV